MAKAFISYSHRDSTVLDRLHTHLAVLRREGNISEWFDREILAGSEIDKDIIVQLESCNIFLALVSPDFLASNYCYEEEMATAIRLHEAGKVRIVPIIIEPCDWQATPLSRFKAIPKDGKPIAEWQNPNTAFLDIVQELRRIAEDEGQKIQIKQNEVFRQQPVEEKRYRLKREFDEIDIANFRDKSYKIIRDYFQSSIIEIDSLEDIRARFADINSFGFTCSILNKALSRNIAHLTVHAQSGRSSGAISYSNEENAPTNTSHGGFQIDANDYEMVLKRGYSMTFSRSSREEETLTALQAAEILWNELLERAGISYI